MGAFPDGQHRRGLRRGSEGRPVRVVTAETPAMLAQRPRACVARAIAGAARSGSIKLIAVASAKRLAEFPDVPTLAETIPGFQATGWGVLVAPVGTSEAIIDKISQDLRTVSLDPELQKKLAPLGSYTNPMSPAEATAFVHRQQQTWQPVLDEIAKNER